MLTVQQGGIEGASYRAPRPSARRGSAPSLSLSLPFINVPVREPTLKRQLSDPSMQKSSEQMNGSALAIDVDETPEQRRRRRPPSKIEEMGQVRLIRTNSVTDVRAQRKAHIKAKIADLELRINELVGQIGQKLDTIRDNKPNADDPNSKPVDAPPPQPLAIPTLSLPSKPPPFHPPPMIIPPLATMTAPNLEQYLPAAETPKSSKQRMPFSARLSNLLFGSSTQRSSARSLESEPGGLWRRRRSNKSKRGSPGGMLPALNLNKVEGGHEQTPRGAQEISRVEEARMITEELVRQKARLLQEQQAALLPQS